MSCNQFANFVYIPPSILESASISGSSNGNVKVQYYGNYNMTSGYDASCKKFR